MAKFKNRLRELRESHGLSQQKVAELVGVSDTAYQRYEYGERDLPAKTLLELVKVYDCTVDEILGVSHPNEVGDPETVDDWVPVPRFGRIAAGSPLTMEEVDDFVDVPAAVRRRHPNGFCLTVEGESMNNILPNGCHAYVAPCTEVEHDGAPYAVCVNGCDATIKRVRKLANGFELLPDSNDPTFRPAVYDHGNPDDDKVTIIGRVVYYVIPYDWEF